MDTREIDARCSAGFTERVRTWDLARAVDADGTLDPAAVDGTEALSRELGVIGPRADVGAGAGPQAQLLGRFGRRA